MSDYFCYLENINDLDDYKFNGKGIMVFEKWCS